MVNLQVTKINSFKDKVIGLIGKKEISPILIQTRWGIHTFFMDEAIDVIILDNNHRIHKHIKSLKPNRIFVWNPLFYNVLECPAGTIEKLKLKKSDYVRLLFQN